MYSPSDLCDLTVTLVRVYSYFSSFNCDDYTKIMYTLVESKWKNNEKLKSNQALEYIFSDLLKTTTTTLKF